MSPKNRTEVPSGDPKHRKVGYSLMREHITRGASCRPEPWCREPWRAHCNHQQKQVSSVHTCMLMDVLYVEQTSATAHCMTLLRKCRPSIPLGAE